MDHLSPSNYTNNLPHSAEGQNQRRTKMNFPKSFLYLVAYVSFFGVSVANTYWQYAATPSAWWTYASIASVVAGVWATWYSWTVSVKKPSLGVYSGGACQKADDTKKAA
jgi:hypothetical protein